MENISNFFKNLVQSRKSKDSNQRPHNPFNEIQLLTGHHDIVRILLKVDDNRFISSSDDAKIILWDAAAAEIIYELVGHTKPVTCFLLLENDVLVSGSVDKSLRFWDLGTGTCTKHIPNCHESSVKCLVSISKGRFCSGGNDRYLCIWTNDGEAVGKIERQEEENLHCLLAISNGSRLVTGSNSHLLRVYRTDTMKFDRIVTHHRESVRCLVTVNEDIFVSASLDGAIVAWRKDLTPLSLHYPDNFNTKYYNYSVHHLLVLQEQYLAACIGNGFQIFNIFTAEKVLDCTTAHASNVNSIISVGYGNHFLTCSADAQIKLWESSKNFREIDVDEDRSRRKRKEYYTHQCIGEMWGHTDQVSVLLKLSETTFVSGGYDNLIIIWRNGEEQSKQRNRDAISTLNILQESYHPIDHSQYQNHSQPISIVEEYHDIQSTEKEESEDDSTEDSRSQFLQGRARSIGIGDSSHNDAYLSNNIGGTESNDSEEERFGTRTVSFGMGTDAKNDSQRKYDGTSYQHEHSLSRRYKYNTNENKQTGNETKRSDSKLDRVSSSSSFENLDTASIEPPTPSSSSSSLKINSSNSFKTEIFLEEQLEPESDLIANTPLFIPLENKQTNGNKQVRVPFYIFEFAENLLKEEHLSVDQIKENLAKQGHSSAIVEAVIMQLKQVGT